MRSLVTSIFLYACESKTLTAELQRKIQAVEMRCYRKILRISFKTAQTGYLTFSQYFSIAMSQGKKQQQHTQKNNPYFLLSYFALWHIDIKSAVSLCLALWGIQSHWLSCCQFPRVTISGCLKALVHYQELSYDSGTKHIVRYYWSRQSFTSLSDLVLRLMEIAHARFLLTDGDVKVCLSYDNVWWWIASYRCML